MDNFKCNENDGDYQSSIGKVAAFQNQQELLEVRSKIAETEAEIAETKAKLKKAEEEGNSDMASKFFTRLNNLEAGLNILRKEKLLLLNQQQQQQQQQGPVTILDLVTKKFPSFLHLFSNSSAHIHEKLDPVTCENRTFGLIGSSIENVLPLKNEVSSFLAVSESVIEYNSESVIESYVFNYIQDIVKGLGLKGEVKVLQGIEVLRLKPDMWLLTVKNIPFLILEVKKPGPNILTNEKIIAQIHQYMLMMRNYHHVQDVFGILTTLEEFRVTWLPDCDKVAASSKLDTTYELLNTTYEHDVNLNTMLYGTNVLPSSDPTFHHFIASAILKAFHGAKRTGHNPRLTFVDRTFFLVDKNHLVWSRLQDIEEFIFTLPKKNVYNFYLLHDFDHGTYGRAWLAASKSKKSSILVFKLRKPMTRKRIRGDDEIASLDNNFAKEQILWGKLGFESRCITLQGIESLAMPFAITCCSPTSGGVSWDRRAWDELKEVVREDHREMIETALSTSPEAALREAISFLIKKGVWHKDLEWRHLGLIPLMKQGILWGTYRLQIIFSFIDFGKADVITNLNKSAAEKNMIDRMNLLLKSCRVADSQETIEQI